MTKKWQEQVTPNTTLGEQLVIMQAKIDELEAKLEAHKDLPMKYKRMEFNAQLQEENTKLRAELGALKAQEPVAHIEIKHMVTVRFHSNCEYGCDLEDGAKLYLAAGAAAGAALIER